ncbi:hypothetical protein GWK47_047240 [Chionoecetes opilio]|uniref:Uncharacterized protein n=1 Tax=Chionoecetes opilio TaxID=41210 RepID=A0A8J4YDU6_CHIOP|nr:hypothetical protein GWK47_047240 [Chionoecetes opilio]
MDVKVLYSFKILDVPGPVPLDEEGGAWTSTVCASSSSESTQRPGLSFFSGSSPSTRPSNSSRPRHLDKIAPEIGDRRAVETVKPSVVVGGRVKNCWAVLLRLRTWSCETKNAMCYGLRQRGNLTERTTLRKESRFQRSGPDISTEDFVSGRTLPSSREATPG